MLEVLLSYLVLYGLKNNIVVANGTGAVQFQREKMYKSFRLLDTVFLVFGVVVCSFITYLLNNYVYVKFNLEYISLSVAVVLVGAYNLIVNHIWSKISTFKHYLYESSFSYVMDASYMFSVIFTIDLTLPIADFSMQILAVAISILVINVLVGFYTESVNRSYVNSSFRNVPSRLFLLAIFSILLHYAGLMF